MNSSLPRRAFLQGSLVVAALAYLPESQSWASQPGPGAIHIPSLDGQLLTDAASLANTGPADAPTGFSFTSKLGYYRGLGLSMVEDLKVSIDGQDLPRKVKLGYEFARAIPTDNPKYQEYKSFQQKFGDDGNTLVAGIKTDIFFNFTFFT